MTDIKIQKTALVTGSAGFIGFHVARCLIKEGWQVIGLDCLSDYYDVTLKRRREEILLHSKNFKSIFGKLEDLKLLERVFEKEKPNIVVHLAAQAGVRYSIDNPESYLQSNIVGTFNLLEVAPGYTVDS